MSVNTGASKPNWKSSDTMDDRLEIHRLIDDEIVALVESRSQVICEWKSSDVVALNILNCGHLIFEVVLSKAAARHLMAQISAGLK